ncbi:MAG: hypothetical protein CMQ61_02920 [Gammaproteobacteria bacterium]|nr:hypothetical protein [Gammaproteobacteria bacterium]
MTPSYSKLRAIRKLRWRRRVQTDVDWPLRARRHCYPITWKAILWPPAKKTSVSSPLSMRFLFKLTLLLFVLAPVALVIAAGLAIEDAPLVSNTAELPSNAVRRARTIVKAHDSRRLPEGAVRTVRLNQRDLALALDYLARESGAGGAKVDISALALRL